MADLPWGHLQSCTNDRESYADSRAFELQTPTNTWAHCSNLATIGVMTLRSNGPLHATLLFYTALSLQSSISFNGLSILYTFKLTILSIPTVPHSLRQTAHTIQSTPSPQEHDYDPHRNNRVSRDHHLRHHRRPHPQTHQDPPTRRRSQKGADEG